MWKKQYCCNLAARNRWGSTSCERVHEGETTSKKTGTALKVWGKTHCCGCWPRQFTTSLNPYHLLFNHRPYLWWNCPSWRKRTLQMCKIVSSHSSRLVLYIGLSATFVLLLLLLLFHEVWHVGLASRHCLVGAVTWQCLWSSGSEGVCRVSQTRKRCSQGQ